MSEETEETTETNDTTENCNEEILVNNTEFQDEEEAENTEEITETAESVETENLETEDIELKDVEIENIESAENTEEPQVQEELKSAEVIKIAEPVKNTENSKKEEFEILTENQYQLFSTGFTEPSEETAKEVVLQEQEEKFTEEKFINDEILESTEIIDEIMETEEPAEAEEEVREETEEIQEEPEIQAPKTVEIEYDSSMGKLETALEIRYSSLKLTSFPIKVSNVPAGMYFPDELVIGNTTLKVGEETVNNCYLKVASNESVKMLEIKHREFKLALSVSLNNDTINAYGNVRYYEISSLIKATRIVKVLEMLEKIFDGTPITFRYNRLCGNITAEDRIESMRIKTMENFFEAINRSGYKFQSDKLPQSDNIYYLLELNSALKENRAVETWCNFTLNRENAEVASINNGDSLIIKRVHKFDKNYSIEEKITMKTPMENSNIFKEKIAGYRKQCWIELRKI